MSTLAESVLVVGGGIAGIQAALDVADQGIKTYLVEKTPSIGGRMAQLDKTFPTLDCSSCILTPKMVQVARHPNIELLTYSEVVGIEGETGSFRAKVLRKSRYVDLEKCTGCLVCVQKCPVRTIPNEFNLNMDSRRAIYVPFPQAVPLKATIDAENCVYFTKGICRVCERVCPTEAIDFEMEPEEVELDVASVIVATGFDLEDAAKKETYGYGVYPNVFTSLEFERLVSSTGPTDGEIVRRSDDAHPREIAFIQCVCSRDVQTNRYCSAFCCMASVKEAILAKEHVPNVSCTVFYMDLRAFGKGYQEFYERASREFGVEFVRSRPAKIEEDPETENLYVTYEDTKTTRLRKKEFDMVVLGVGVDPQPLELLTSIDSDGFASISEPYNDPAATQTEGIFVIGMAAEAQDVPDSVMQAGAAAMKAAIIASEGGVQDV